MQMFRMLVAAAAVLSLPALTDAPPAHAQGAQNPSFNLLNRGGSAITQVFVTPAGDARWGQNRLQGRSIPVGGSFAVRRRVDGNCIFDIRVVFADHRILDRRNLNTCNTDDVAVGGGTPAAAGATRKAADDPSFRLVNQASQPVTELFATPAGDARWGQNRLDTPLPPRAGRVIAIAKQPNTCLYDLRVVFADHSARERHRTDLCRVSELPVQ